MELYVSVTKASSLASGCGYPGIHHSPDAGCFAITIKNTAAGRRHWGATLLQLELEYSTVQYSTVQYSTVQYRD